MVNAYGIHYHKICCFLPTDNAYGILESDIFVVVLPMVNASAFCFWLFLSPFLMVNALGILYHLIFSLLLTVNQLMPTA